jgi:hypothetical protein
MATGHGQHGLDEEGDVQLGVDLSADGQLVLKAPVLFSRLRTRFFLYIYS